MDTPFARFNGDDMTAKKPRKSYSQAARLQDMVRLIASRRGVTIRELTERYEVHRRTIHRDLNELEQSGYPLYSDEVDGEKAWRFEESFNRTPPVTLSLSELISLYVSKNQLNFLAGTPFKEDFDNIFGKLEKTLSEKNYAHMRQLERKFYLLPDFPKNYSGSLDLIYDIVDALVRSFACVFSYRAAGSPRAKRHIIKPYTLLIFRRGLYLVGHCETYGEVRTFAVDRIEKLEVTRERFEYPDDYSPEKLTEGSFGIMTGPRTEVVIKFDAKVADYVRERRFHPTQEIEELPDGSIVFRMTVNGTTEVISWVLSFGGKAEVVEPAELRAKVRESVEEALARYRPVTG